MIGADRETSWTTTNLPASSPRFYRVQRFSFEGDEDGDGLSSLAEFNLWSDLHPADSGTVGLPADMIVGQTATLGAFGGSGSCTCSVERGFRQGPLHEYC